MSICAKDQNAKLSSKRFIEDRLNPFDDIEFLNLFETTDFADNASILDKSAGEVVAVNDLGTCNMHENAAPRTLRSSVLPIYRSSCVEPVAPRASIDEEQINNFVSDDFLRFDNHDLSFEISENIFEEKLQSTRPAVSLHPAFQNIFQVLHPKQSELHRSEKESGVSMMQQLPQLPRQRYSENSTPSKYCHICGRNGRYVKLRACQYTSQSLCRKVVCAVCISQYDSDYEVAVVTSSSPWICTHCRGHCPFRARCVQYFRNNEKRRAKNLKRRKLRQELKF